MTTLDERANGTRIALRPGAAIALRLAENPTTGYRWQIDSAGEPALASNGDRYERPPFGKPGAGGHHLWSFRAVATGTGVVRLSYRRRGGASAQAFAITVEVR
jgi:inhibitor of cysteine peptidase